jgi:hypothetical protein
LRQAVALVDAAAEPNTRGAVPFAERSYVAAAPPAQQVGARWAGVAAASSHRHGAPQALLDEQEQQAQ